MIEVIQSIWEAIKTLFDIIGFMFDAVSQVIMYLFNEGVKLGELIANSLGWSIELIYLIFPASWAIVIVTGLLIAGFYKAVGRN